MKNKLEKIGQNRFMDFFVKTDDILNDMCGLLNPHKKLYIRQSILHLFKVFSEIVATLEPHLEDKKNGAYDRISLSDL